MRRVPIEIAVEYLRNDDTYRKDIYVVLNKRNRNILDCTGRVGKYNVCRVDRGQCDLNRLSNIAKTAFIKEV